MLLSLFFCEHEKEDIVRTLWRHRDPDCNRGDNIVVTNLSAIPFRVSAELAPFRRQANCKSRLITVKSYLFYFVKHADKRRLAIASQSDAD